MKNLFRKVDKIVLGIFLFAAMIATVATAMEKRRATQWYSVTVIDNDQNHNDPANQQIGAALTGEPTGDCATENENTRCAIQLTIGTANPTVPATVQAALNREMSNPSDVDIVGNAFWSE